jgi:hypothetical protein
VAPYARFDGGYGRQESISGAVGKHACPRCGSTGGAIRLASIPPADIPRSIGRLATTHMDGIPVTRIDLVAQMLPPHEPQWRPGNRRDALPAAVTIAGGIASALLLLCPVGHVLAPDSALPIIALSITTIVLGLLLAAQPYGRARTCPRRHREMVRTWLAQMDEWNRLHYCASCADVFLSE